MKYLIVDDEPLAHNVVLAYAEELPFLELVGQAYKPVKALELIAELKPELIFLDVKMPKLTGIEMIKLLDYKPQVIITSAYSEYALESYDLNVCDYLLKPFRLDRFILAVDKAVQKKKLSASEIDESDGKLFVKVDKKYVQIEISQIHYLESYGNYVKIWSGNSCHLTASTMTNFEKSLPNKSFFKIHKSFLVNKDNIDFMEGNMLTMKNSKQISVSKNYKKEFLAFLIGE